MKIALTASYFNCPPVAELLQSCDIVYTTNDYALVNFTHKNMRTMKRWEDERFQFTNDEIEFIKFGDVRLIFNDWVANKATDDDLIAWSNYFNTHDAEKMRAMARSSIVL